VSTIKGIYIREHQGKVEMADIPDVTSPRVIRELFEHYGLNPRRQFGQNFLIDGNIVNKILAAVEIAESDAIIEIGPGAGALTIAMARTGASVIAFEIDHGLARLLKDLLQPWPNVRVIEKDALKIKWQDLIDSYFATGASVKLVSNLPYAISGPFMYALFKEKMPFKSAVLMFQKEVAQRLVADPGDSDYGGISVFSRYYAEGKVLFDVSNNVFWPRPKVGSAVLKLKPRRRELSSGEEALFWHLVQGVFQQRRKTMLNNMTRLFPHARMQLPDLMAETSIDPAIRPEQLTADQFAMLARIIYNYHNQI
jgi:16S rRNA (adenine1518-N6/adenine1519-N6)-dimethyltransferase